MGRVDLSLQQLTQLRKNFKTFSLVLFDRWRADFHTTTTWRKNNIKSNKYINGQNIGWLDLEILNHPAMKNG